MSIYKSLVVISIALLFSSTVFNNLIDFSINYEYIKKVLGMDLISNESLKWRAIHGNLAITAFYLCIIVWEILIALFCWIGAFLMLRFGNTDRQKYLKGKTLSLIGFTAAFLLFVSAFATVGGQWFYMWQVGNIQLKAFSYAILMISCMIFVSSHANE